MKVEALKNFYDLEGKTDRKPGDIFEASKERFEALKNHHRGELVCDPSKKIKEDDVTEDLKIEAKATVSKATVTK